MKNISGVNVLAAWRSIRLVCINARIGVAALHLHRREAKAVNRFNAESVPK